MESPLWPAKLDHVSRESDDPQALVDFYSRVLDFDVEKLADQQWLLRGPERKLLIAHGSRGSQSMYGFRMTDADHLRQMREYCLARSLHLDPVQTPLFDQGFSIVDPDGRRISFGLPVVNHVLSDTATQRANGRPRLPGRLQHVVVATEDLPTMVAFYRDTLGFITSDDVYDGDPDDGAEVSASFYRSDPEHHSFAVFRAPQAGPDHFSLEANEWNDIRDWADHLADLHIKLWWGPGRHGAGNNLFFMIEDPEGYKLEISAELELMPQEMASRNWQHEERTLNLWGGAWMRS